MSTKEFDKDACQIGKQLNIEVSSMDELEVKLEEMNLALGLNMKTGAWVVFNSNQEVLAEVE